MRKFIEIISETNTPETVEAPKTNLRAIFESITDPLRVVSHVRALHNQFLEERNAAIPAHDKTRQFNARRSSSFHLTPCDQCYAPVWQQPCPVCDYYPMGQWQNGVRVNSPEWEAHAAQLRATAKDQFLRHIHKAGNIAAWYFEDMKDTVAYNKREPHNADWHFRTLVDKYIEIAKDQQFPDGEAIWDAYGKHDAPVTPSPSDPAPL